MKMASSGSRTSAFDSVLKHLAWLTKTCKILGSGNFDAEAEFKWYSQLDGLKDNVRVLIPFDLYVTNCRRKQEMCWEHDLEEKGNTKSDSLRLSIILWKIQDLARTIMPGPESAVSTYIQSGAPNFIDLKTKLTRFEENVRLFLETEIRPSCIISLLHHYSLGDPRLVTNLIDSVLKNLDWLTRLFNTYDNALSFVMITLEAKLLFLQSFICFATVQGVEGKGLIDLLIHAEVVAVKAARLISICWFDRKDKQMPKEMEFQISRLIRKEIDPVDPQVRETYIHVLTASKLPRSSHTSVLEKNKHLLANFIDCLLYNVMELLEHFPSFSVLVKDQMLILHGGVRLLCVLLRQQQEKFDGLHDQMKDLIGFVACDAGIVILSLSATEMKEGLAKETDLALFHLVKVLKFIMAEFAQIYPPSSFSFPWTDELGCFDFLLESLQDLSNSEADSIDFPKNHIDRVQEDLTFLRSLLKNIVGQRNQNVKLQALWNRGMEVAYKAKLLINSIVFGDKSECLDTLAGDIELMRTEALGICDSLGHGTDTQRVTTNSADTTSKLRTPALNEAPVGLDEAVKIIINRLTRSSKQLDIVSIVGMGGLGKTTLANTVYNRMQNSVCRHFHIHAWCTVSQAYSKHNLLAQILCSIHHGSPGEYLNKDEDDLAEELRRVLLRNRYLIVLDDLWDIEAWNLLERSFPNDLSGSRILLTSRIHSLPLQLKHDSEPYHLHQLTDKESWTLLQNKLFGKEGCCPPTLNEVGFQIAKNCKGLPLTIVLVAGILATTEQDCWKEVAQTLCSSTIVETEQCKRTLELSYSNLPGHLRPCLLYFGAFQEDANVPVRKLMWLWSYEGFLQKTEGKSLEDAVDEYLTDLVQRSLVMVTRQRSIGGAKACRIHDLIHEFCVEKAKEESFLQISHGKNDLFTLTGPHNLHRLCIYNTEPKKLKNSKVFFPNLRSLLFFAKWQIVPYFPTGVLLFKLLGVLDLGGFDFIYGFPMEVVLLVHLRYLAISSIRSVPPEIANLSRLETFLVTASCNVGLPNTIWNIHTLRHLCVTNFDWGFCFPADSLAGCPDLKRLETLSLAIDSCSQSLQKILTKLPSIRRLKCVALESSIRRLKYVPLKDSSSSRNWILVLDGPSGLESLKVRNLAQLEIKFPLYLKKLTVSRTDMPWSEISTIGKLPSLEVLKLRYKAFVGKKWEMKAGEFLNLRFLELSGLDLRSWTATSDNFFRLEKLVLHQCWQLEEVPSCLGECSYLEMIELKRCRESAVTSVKQIQQEQMDAGNEGLRVILENNSSEAE